MSEIPEPAIDLTTPTLIESVPEHDLLRPTFDRLKDEDDPDGPIDRLLLAPFGTADFELFERVVLRALEYFTGEGASVARTGRRVGIYPEVRVTAPGRRATGYR